MKIYGVNNSDQFKDVRRKLFSIFAEYSGSTTSSSSTITAPKPTDRKALAKPNRMRMVKLYAYLVIYVILLLYNIYTLNLPINYIHILCFFMQEFETYGGSDLSQKNQLESYLEEPRLDSNVDLNILEFWKVHELRYPIVAAMARDILSIPISTVALESTFSVGGRVIDQYRSSLKPNIVEALICTRDWLYGEQGNFSFLQI